MRRRRFVNNLECAGHAGALTAAARPPPPLGRRRHGRRPPEGPPLARHVQQSLPSRDRHGRRRSAGERRLPGHDPAQAALLRAAALRLRLPENGQAPARRDEGRARAGARGRHPHHRPRAELRLGVPRRADRALSRASGGEAVEGVDADAERVPRPREGRIADAARESSDAGALSPPRDHEDRRGGRGAAEARPRPGDARRRLLRQGRRVRLRARALRGVDARRRAHDPAEGARGRAGHDRHRRRLQLPRADRAVDAAPGHAPRTGAADGGARRRGGRVSGDALRRRAVAARPRQGRAHRGRHRRRRGALCGRDMAAPQQAEAIADYAAIGDTRSIALISRRGSIDWLCWPRFDAPSIFGRLLDAGNGGHFSIAPAAQFTATRRYVDDTNVLETTFACDVGEAKLIDLMPVMTEEEKQRRITSFRQLLRRVECVRGEVRLRVEFLPRPDYARTVPRLELRGDCVHCGWGARVLNLRSDARFDERGIAEFTLRAGETKTFALGYDDHAPAVFPRLDEDIEASIGFWRKWSSQLAYKGPYRDAMMRSALVLKLLTYAPSGGGAAAAARRGGGASARRGGGGGGVAGGPACLGGPLYRPPPTQPSRPLWGALTVN